VPASGPAIMLPALTSPENDDVQVLAASPGLLHKLRHARNAVPLVELPTWLTSLAHRPQALSTV